MKKRALSFEVGDHPDVEVRVAAGRVQVDTGSPGTIGVFIGARNPDKLVVEQFGDHIQIGEDGRLRGSYRIRLEVPPGTDLACTVASGDVEVRAPVGDLTARSASGDVEVTEALGRAELKVASGDVTIERAAGDTRVATASGDVRIDEADQDCAVATASGDISLGTVRGALRVKTTSGTTSVDRYEGTMLQAKSVSGRIDLRIPSGRRADVDIRTLSGAVTLPFPRSEPGPAPTHVVAVQAKSVSGDIAIDRAD